MYVNVDVKVYNLFMYSLYVKTIFHLLLLCCSLSKYFNGILKKLVILDTSAKNAIFISLTTFALRIMIILYCEASNLYLNW